MLSREKIDECFKQPGEDGFGKSCYDVARAIEAAVLEEQAKQKPVAWVYYPRGVGEKYVSYINPASLDLGKQANQIAYIQPLYLHPSPVPEGMVLVPREPTNKMLEAAAQISLMTIGWDALKYKAMIAAAEKP